MDVLDVTKESLDVLGIDELRKTSQVTQIALQHTQNERKLKYMYFTFYDLT